ncbi:MAG: hypothetical protein P4M07_05830, partial [Xanthobacteraceae bacterium]|nr:hypothetical protein [Xanthobacteraceae bacterium]
RRISAAALRGAAAGRGDALRAGLPVPRPPAAAAFSPGLERGFGLARGLDLGLDLRMFFDPAALNMLP